MPCEQVLSMFQAFSWKGTKTIFVTYKIYNNFNLGFIDMQGL